MKFNTSNKEVLVAKSNKFNLDKNDLNILKSFATSNISGKSRICSHKNDTDLLHEMFIFHKRDYYVRPHRHFNKSESIMILKGKVDLVLFNDDGVVQDLIHLDEFLSGKKFYNRINEPIFHTLIIKSNYVIFYEATTGPFNKKDTEFAEWSPKINTPESKIFMKNISNDITKL